METKHSLDSTERRYSLLFIIFSVVAIFEGILVLSWILSIPGDAKNALAAGLSLYRLVLVGGVVGILLAFMGGLVGYRFSRQVRDFVERHLAEQRYLRLWSLVGLLLALAALVPAVEWGRWGAAFTRLLPFITWLSVLSLQWAVALRAAKGDLVADLVTGVKGLFINLKPVLLPAFAGLAAVYILAVGLYPAHQGEDYWYENGVPILLWQIIIAVLAGVLFSRYQFWIRLKLGKRTDLVMFLTIFILCGALWAFSPLEHSFFNPKPLPPNYNFYPYSDAARFDLQAQSALLGLGLDRGTPVDRPFYPSLLGLIHLFTGQEYSANVMLQAFLFGVFPALIYLICSEMGARNWGVVSSLVVAFWGQNALLVHSRLNTASPKQMLTDFPLAITLSLLMYITVRWLKGGDHQLKFAFIAGGMLALSAYIRYSALLLLPIWMTAAFLVNPRKFKQGIIRVLVMTAGFILVVAPWYMRNISSGMDVYIPFQAKVFFIIEQRYDLNDGPGRDELQVEPSEEDREWKDSDRDQAPKPETVQKPDFGWIGAHLVHNVLSSLMVLPSFPEMASVNTTLDLRGEIWDQYWAGRLPPFQLGILLLQFMIIGMGIAALIKTAAPGSAMLLWMFAGVQLANALGRTSGGRYIVPVNWVVLVVYAAGILFLFNQLKLGPLAESVENTAQPKSGGKLWAGSILLVLLIGAAPVMFESFTGKFSGSARQRPAFEVHNILVANEGTSWEAADLDHFLNSWGAKTVQGYAFYPRLERVEVNRDFNSLLENSSERTVRVLTFSVLSAEDEITAYLHGEDDFILQNQDEVILFGCQRGDEILVRDLFVLKDTAVYHYQSAKYFNGCD